MTKLQDAVEEAQGKGLLVLPIIFGANDLSLGCYGRFTPTEVAKAIEYINEFGAGFEGISSYALTQIQKYLEKQVEVQCRQETGEDM